MEGFFAQINVRRLAKVWKNMDKAERERDPTKTQLQKSDVTQRFERTIGFGVEQKTYDAEGQGVETKISESSTINP